MTIRMSGETIVLVAVVIVIFLLALVCLACSLNPRELLDGSFFRCCQCCGLRRRRRPGASMDEEARHYETLNEFIFESEEDSRGPTGAVSMNSMPTTMEQVFPDLLGSDEMPSVDVENPLFGTSGGGANAELREPLL